jgi:histidinol-phosphate aminotransferase
VVIDEAYEAFSPDSYLKDLKRSPRLLLLRTLSKVGLAGIRLGYLIGAKALIAEFDKVRPPYNINVLSQCAAQFALEHSEVLKQQADILIEQRAWLSRELSMRAGVTVFDSKANFLLFRLDAPEADAAARVFAGVRSNGVLIKNVSAAHALLRNCLRVTVSTAEENRAFLAAFDHVWPVKASRAA